MITLRKFLADEHGGTAIEYSLIGGLVSIAIISGLSAIGSTISSTFFGPVSNALGGSSSP